MAVTPGESCEEVLALPRVGPPLQGEGHQAQARCPALCPLLQPGDSVITDGERQGLPIGDDPTIAEGPEVRLRAIAERVFGISEIIVFLAAVALVCACDGVGGVAANPAATAVPAAPAFFRNSRRGID